MMINVTCRWATDDGRKWPYDGPANYRLSDAPADVIKASKENVVTDRLVGDSFRANADGTLTVWLGADR